jgi:hypothetical protein
MPHRLTAFAQAAAKLKAPAAEQFSLSGWDAAYQAHGATESDRRLYEAAKWIGAEADAGRRATARTVGPALAALTPEWSTILAIAALNREYRTATVLKKDQDEGELASGILAADASAAARIRGAEGQIFSVSDIAEHGVDTTENWLFDASRTTGSNTATGDLGPIAAMAMRSYSFRKSLNALWNGAWSDGDFCVEETSGVWRWKSGDPRWETLMVAWQARQESNLMNFPNIDRTVWPKMKPADRRKRSRGWGVTALSTTKGSTKFKVRSLQYLSRFMPAYQFERAALEGSYLADFLDDGMPNDPVLTVGNLLLAWHAILDIAELLTKQAPLTESLSPQAARALALVVSRTAIRDAIGKALRVSDADADTITDFLTFTFQTGGRNKKSGNKGLWAAPLVPVPGTDDVAIPFPVLTTSNPARRAENWLEKGGINDKSKKGRRGDRYEALYRAKACEAVASNSKFRAAFCAAREIKESVCGEQVDLLVSFGGLCLVGEVKFFLMPTDPHERDRYDEKLRGAAEQAKRKAAALDARRDVVADYLGVSQADADALRLLPVIVTAQGYGFSARFDDVLVIDAEFLRLYLKGDDLVTGRALVPATGRYSDVTTPLYRTESGAARNFEANMSSPFVLTRYIERVVWSETPFPCLAHHAAVLDVALLGDLIGFERMQAEIMKARMT